MLKSHDFLYVKIKLTLRLKLNLVKWRIHRLLKFSDFIFIFSLLLPNFEKINYIKLKNKFLSPYHMKIMITDLFAIGIL